MRSYSLGLGNTTNKVPLRQGTGVLEEGLKKMSR